jgi:hypothetical protein
MGIWSGAFPGGSRLTTITRFPCCGKFETRCSSAPLGRMASRSGPVSLRRHACSHGAAAFQPRYDNGTMVATILVRTARRPVDIVPLPVDDSEGCPRGMNPPCQPSALRVASAIRKAEARVTAINMSLALENHPPIVEAVRDAATKGILIVLAAGNGGLDHPGKLSMAKAAYPNSVLVGAVDDRGRAWSGSNRPGSQPETTTMPGSTASPFPPSARTDRRCSAPARPLPPLSKRHGSWTNAVAAGPA